MFYKIIFGTTGTLAVVWTGMAIASDSFHKKLDRNVLKPVRNYRMMLKELNKMQTQEEFYQFLGQFSTGFKNMFIVEED